MPTYLPRNGSAHKYIFGNYSGLKKVEVFGREFKLNLEEKGKKIATTAANQASFSGEAFPENVAHHQGMGLGKRQKV
jgi:hypothetical protein